MWGEREEGVGGGRDVSGVVSVWGEREEGVGGAGRDVSGVVSVWGEREEGVCGEGGRVSLCEEEGVFKTFLSCGICIYDS